MGYYNPNMPADNQTGAVLISQLLANDAMQMQIDPNAALTAGLVRGDIVVFDRLHGVWVKANAAALPDKPVLGIVEHVAGNTGQVRTGGTYQAANISPNLVYYCQTNGTLGTAETDVLAGHSTSAGNLLLTLNGGGSYGGKTGFQVFSNAGTHVFKVTPGIKQIKVTCIGGAGGGGGGLRTGITNPGGANGGNGATGWINYGYFNVSSMDSYLVSVGSGGIGGSRFYSTSWAQGAGLTGGTGGTSSFGNLLSATGGAGGTGGSYSNNGFNPGVSAFSYTYRSGFYTWCSIAGVLGTGDRNNSTDGTPGTAGAVIVEW